MALTAKQKAFCESFVASGNATKAAKEAGYSPKTASVIGSENLDKPNIVEYVKKLQKEISDKKLMSAVERQEILTNIARDRIQPAVSRIRAVDVMNKMTGEYAAVEAEHEIENLGALAEMLKDEDDE